MTGVRNWGIKVGSCAAPSVARTIRCTRDQAKEAQAEQINFCLQQKGWSQADLARASSLPKYTISRATSGKHLISEGSLRLIANALGIDPEALIQSERRDHLDEAEEGFEAERQADGRFRIRVNATVESGVQLVVEALLMQAAPITLNQVAKILGMLTAIPEQPA